MYKRQKWQIKNLNAIVWLYRGEVEKYHKLISKYLSELNEHYNKLVDTLHTYGFRGEENYEKKMQAYCDEVCGVIPQSIPEFAKFKTILVNGKKYISEYRNGKTSFLKDIPKEKLAEQFDYYKKTGTITLGWVKKAIENECSMYEDAIDELDSFISDAWWLYEKFGDGEYKDILGLCKVATRAEIAEKNYSLTPGAYVGVEAPKEDNVNFAERMAEIHKELLKLQAESNELMNTISKNMEEMGL